MTTQNNKNGRFLGHFQTFSFGLVGKAQEVKKIPSHNITVLDNNNHSVFVLYYHIVLVVK